MFFFRPNTPNGRLGLADCQLCECKLHDGSRRLLTYLPTLAGYRGETATKRWLDEKTREIFDEEVLKWRAVDRGKAMRAR